MNIVRAHLGDQSATLYVGCDDLAVDFADWLTQRGFAVTISDGLPDAHPRTPREAELADALTAEYAAALASRAGA